MGYCVRDDLKSLVLDAYLLKVEELNAGSIALHIEQVSGEIDDALRCGGYELPLVGVPPTIKWIASAIVAYRVIGEITTLMASEASSGNEWIPVQRQHDRALKTLEKIRTGEYRIYPDPEEAGTGEIRVVAPRRIFDERMWRMY